VRVTPRPGRYKYTATTQTAKPSTKFFHAILRSPSEQETAALYNCGTLVWVVTGVVLIKPRPAATMFNAFL